MVCLRVKNHLVTGMHPQAVPECTPLRLMAIPGDGGIEAEAACPWFGQPSCRWCFSSLVKPSSCFEATFNRPWRALDVQYKMYIYIYIYLMVEENMLVLACRFGHQELLFGFFPWPYHFCSLSRSWTRETGFRLEKSYVALHASQFLCFPCNLLTG